MEWIPPERRKRGRPRKTCMEGVQAAMTSRDTEPEQRRNREEWLLGSGRWRQLLNKPDRYKIITTQNTILRDVNEHNCFEGNCCLHLQGKILQDGHHSILFHQRHCTHTHITLFSHLKSLMSSSFIPTLHKLSNLHTLNYTGCFTTLGHKCRR